MLKKCTILNIRATQKGHYNELHCNQNQQTSRQSNKHHLSRRLGAVLKYRSQHQACRAR